MKASKTDEKTQNRNARSRVSAKKSSGGGPRGRENSSVRGRESGQVRGEDAGGSEQQQKVGPGRAKTKSSRNTNQRRAS